jgi:hypothetical protein
MKIDNLLLSIFMWIWKIIFQLWKFFISILNNYLIWTWNLIPNYYFGFSKLILQVWKLVIESKNGHFNFEYFYLNMKINISILQIVI